VIVRTATRLFSAHGYDGMNLDDVAEQTDIAKATLYHYYFSGKDELAAAVLEALTSDVQQEARKIVNSALNASN
jgi:TetR/AcrR family transcriptional regulator of autoinduction and epiphytic fitness